MIFRLVSAESNKLPPGPIRHFGGADPYNVDIRWDAKSSYIPKRKDKVPKKEEPPQAPDIPEVKRADIVPEPEPEPEPEPRRAPPALMSRQAMGKAMKTARKIAHAKTARPMMRSTGQLPKLQRRTEAAKSQKKPKAPPFELNDDAIREAARKALNRFTQRKVLHPIAVMATMLDPYAEEQEYEQILITHAVSAVRDEIKDAETKSVNIDRRFLHAKSARAFGKLVGLAWSRLKIAEPYIRPRRRGRFNVFMYEGEGSVIYFLVEPTRRLQAIHIAMGPPRFKQWICGHDCCPTPGSRSSRRRIEA